MNRTAQAAGFIGGVLGATLGLVAMFSAPVNAAQYNVPNDHQQLLNAVERAGVAVQINPGDKCDGKAHGYYYPGNPGVLVICQDNARGKGITHEVAWTNNDLDTIRHEAHHLVQDCLAFRRGDGALRPMFTDLDELYNFAISSGLTDANIENIINNYTDNGASREVVVLEIEAFSVAAGISASNIAEAVGDACPAVY